ncbi:MAG: bifunctional (p)ppGpp synthetase/guanosine-3',5'-bis(diphosphate) 3'-pyrophosphohydrolase [Pseudomonadota bacterium]
MHYPDADLDLIRRAYAFSGRVHDGQTRRSGEPYLVHPLAVALILAQMKLDEASVATGLLHDTVEDTRTTFAEIEAFFGIEIAKLVDGVTKISKMEFQSKEQRQAESFRKMILAMSQDIRVLLVKLADRLHNMRTLHYMPADAQRRIAQETLDIYGPLASRLGIYWMRTQLEELAFSYLNTEVYENLRCRRDESVKEQEKYVDSILEIIKDKLSAHNYVADIKHRTKDLYSIHRKMMTQNIDFEQIHDLTAFRIIVDTVSNCYAVLGFMHSLWRPVPGRFKDYVAMPKRNGYQSLHTTVVGPEGRRIEIQIRTPEMDMVAEEGIAAHWSYKEGKHVKDEDTELIGWLRQWMEWQKDLEDPREFFENVRVDLYPDEVYVFTPKGEVKEFPKNATPLDFAYSIHTEVGHRCVGAKINGKMVPLKYELQTGDTVEIVTSPHQKPGKDWLKIVKTARAKTKIRQYVLAEERDRAIEMGRDTTERELKKWRIDLVRAEKEGEVLQLAKEHSFRNETDLYAAIGYGRVSPKMLITKLVPPQEREKAKADLKLEKGFKKQPSADKSGIRVQGLMDVMVKFAKCCNPLPGDSIKGIITKGRGVSVHAANCLNIAAVVDTRRVVDVSWDEEQPQPRTVKLSVHAKNQVGLLAIIGGVFSSNNSDIVKAQMEAVNDELAQGTFIITVNNLEHLNRIIHGLKNVKLVEKVERM